MTKVREQLIGLVSAAVKGGEGDIGAVDGIDWKALLAEASRQGVKGLVWSFVQSHPTCASSLSFEDKMEWYGNVRMTEAKIAKMWDEANEFATTLNEHCPDLRCVVLKGIDYAHYWPNPLHREFGDLDSWFGDDFERSNETAESIGARVEYHGDDKHTHTRFNGLMVENHRDFTDRLSRMDLLAEDTLREFMALRPARPMADNLALFSPNENFSALYLVLHAQGHFDEGIRLRHVLDWLFFVRAKQAEIDWARVVPAMKALGIYNFACCMTEICITLGADFKEIRNKHFGDFSGPCKELSRRMRDDIMGEQPYVYDMRMWKKALRILRRSRRLWTFRSLLSESYFHHMWTALAYNSVTGLKPKFG